MFHKNYFKKNHTQIYCRFFPGSFSIDSDFLLPLNSKADLRSMIGVSSLPLRVKGLSAGHLVTRSDPSDVASGLSAAAGES